MGDFAMRISTLTCIPMLLLSSPLRGQTSRPTDRKDPIAYWQGLMKLDTTELRQKGRDRAERAYSKGRAELEWYGLLAKSLGDHRYIDGNMPRFYFGEMDRAFL